MKRFILGLLLLITALFAVYGRNIFLFDNLKINQNSVSVAHTHSDKESTNQDSNVKDQNDKCEYYNVYDRLRSESGITAKDYKGYILTYKESKYGCPNDSDIEKEISIRKMIMENGDGHKVTFHFPKDCADYQTFFGKTNDLFNGSQSEINTLVGIYSRCTWIRILEQEKKDRSKINSVYDFVSKYDYKNASLDDISSWIDCVGVMGNEGEERCDRIDADENKMALEDYYSYLEMRLLELGEFKDIHDLRRKTTLLPRDKSCRLKNGRFAGTVYLNNGVIKCDYDEDEEGIYVGGVSFIDVNQDGFLDVVIGVGASSISSSAPMAYHYEVYTKKSATQKRFTRLDKNFSL